MTDTVLCFNLLELNTVVRNKTIHECIWAAWGSKFTNDYIIINSKGKSYK